MSGKFIFYPVLCCYFLIPVHAHSQENMDTMNRFEPHVSYTGDAVRNFSGGIKTGNAYAGMVNAMLSIKPWKGGVLYINAANTHGGEPSADLFGDYQVASNIEAGNHTYLQELWYRHHFKRLILTLGLQDLNIDLANSSYGSVFLNSSFGIMPTISGNIPAPIFPLTSLGLCASWNMTKKSILHVAVFDGAPTDFEDNPHNLKWEVSQNEGFLLFMEFQHGISIRSLPGTIKTGIYIHNHFSERSTVTRDTVFRNNNGLYIIGEQALWNQKGGNRSLGIFFQLGLSPHEMSPNKHYMGFGFHFAGIMNHQGNDILGLGVAHDVLRNQSENETTIELTYQLPILKWLILQPDLQYIINPAGTEKSLDNCLAGFFRINIKF